jgi:hypothetical protein
LEVSEATVWRWRSQYGGLKADSPDCKTLYAFLHVLTQCPVPKHAAICIGVCLNNFVGNRRPQESNPEHQQELIAHNLPTLLGDDLHADLLVHF